MSQITRLYELLSDNKAHRTDEICRVVYGGESLGLSRVGARINDLVNLGAEFSDKFGNKITGKNVMRGWRDKNNAKLYWYKMQNDPFKKINNYNEKIKTVPTGKQISILMVC